MIFQNLEKVANLLSGGIKMVQFPQNACSDENVSFEIIREF